MPRPAGEPAKLGHEFEAVWTVDAVLDVYLGKTRSITIEAFGDESLGVEFHLTTNDHKLQFHSVKRQKQGGDWSVAKLCETKPSTGRSILGDLFQKRKTHAHVELRFISATGANQLRELSERADNPTNLKEFRQAIGSSAKLNFEFDHRIVPLCSGDADLAFAAMKSLEVIPISHKELTRRVEQRIETSFYCKNGSAFEPGEIRRMIAEFVVENLGPELHADDISGFLDEKGFGEKDWKHDKTVNETVAKINKRYSDITEWELINSAQIVRKESKKILTTIDDGDSKGALLVAPGGYGKSCVLSQVLNQLRTSRLPVLVLRMDAVEACNSSKQLGQQLDLPASPAIVLAGIADNAPCVLFVDQLDAMSRVSGRNQFMWEVFQELRAEVRSYPNMKLPVARSLLHRQKTPPSN